MQVIYHVHVCKRLFIVKMLQPQKKGSDMFCQYISLWQLRLTLTGVLKPGSSSNGGGNYVLGATDLILLFMCVL